MIEDEEELDIKINVGTSGVRSASKKKELSKRHDYEKIRSEVDGGMIVKFLELLDKVDTKMQFFTLVEDAGIPLITLVALGVTTEESVNAYQTLRSRGLDTYTADISKTQRVDDDYANEILMYTEEYPRLKEVGVGSVEEPLTARELYKEESKQVIELEKEIRSLENKVRELEVFEPEEEELEYEERVKDEVLDISDVFGDIEEETELDDEDKLSQEDYSDWNSRFENLKNTIVKEDREETEELEKVSEIDNNETEAVKSVHKVRKHEEKEKEIYVLSESFELEEKLEGYKVIFIDQPEDLMLFSASKDNLLVITRAIPYQLVEMFLEWVESVSERGIKVRAVTLKGLEIEHALIEDVVELTQESLDRYYEEYKRSRYLGTGVSTFFDIEESLKGLDIE